MARDLARGRGEDGSDAEGRSGQRAERGGRLDRRDYLRLGATAAAVAAGSAAASGNAAATSGLSRWKLSFDRAVNAVDDLGIDPTGNEPINAKLEGAMDDGTLVQFPPGTYLVDDEMLIRADNFGVESTTGNREDVVFRPTRNGDHHLFKGNVTSGFYVGHVTLDRLDDWEHSMGLFHGNFRRDVYVTDILVDGWTPSEQLLIWNLYEGEGLIEKVEKTGPSIFREYPQGELTIYMGPTTEATVTYRNLEIHNATESAIYCGKDNGIIRVEDSYFKNCVHTAVRVTGKDSHIKNCTVVMDTDDWHPETVNDTSTYVRDPSNTRIQLNRGIWVQSGSYDKQGTVIEDCEVVVNGDAAIAGIMINGDTGGSTIRNTRVRLNSPSARGILAQRPNNTAVPPYEIEMEGVSVTGHSGGRPGVEIRGRDGSFLRNSCINLPNTDGVVFTDVDNGEISDCTIDVGGRATTFHNCQVSTSGISADGSCPLPDVDGWRGSSDGSEETSSDGSDSGSDADGDSGTGSDSDSDADAGGSDESTSDESPADADGLPYSLGIRQAKEGERTQYEFAVSGNLESGRHANLPREQARTRDDGTMWAYGFTGHLRGFDNFHYDGHLTEFSVVNADYGTFAFIDPVTEDILHEFDPAVVGEHLLVIRNTGDSSVDFRVDVDGALEPDANALGASLSEGGAQGTVPAGADRTFHFAGDLNEVAVSDPAAVRLLVDGQQVTPAEISGEGSQYSYMLGVRQAKEGERTQYEFAVSGDLEPGRHANLPREQARIRDDGTMWAYGFTGRLRGFDNFHFNGHLTEFSAVNADYGTFAFLDPATEEVLHEFDPAVIGANVLSIAYEGDSAARYDILVDGDVEPDANALGATVEGGHITGTIDAESNEDTFHFVGDVTRIAVSDPSSVSFSLNGDAVSPEELRSSSDELTNTLRIAAGSNATYSFTVSGDLEATQGDDQNVSGSSAEGALADDEHVYRYSGTVTAFDLSGHAHVYRNGTEISPEEISAQADRVDAMENAVVFDGTLDDGVTSYRFSVDGDVMWSEERSADSDSGWDALKSHVDGNDVSGLVHNGVDVFLFSGEVTDMDVRGSAVVSYEEL